MAIKLTCYKDGETYDITQLVQSITWSGDINSCSRKLEFKIVSSASDMSIPKFNIPLSSLITFYENDKELFRGFVFEREKSSDSTSMSFLCYDYAERLNKIKVSYNIKNKTANEILEMVLKDYGIKQAPFTIGTTKIKKIFIGTTIYEMIQTAYTYQSKSDNKRYMIFANRDSIGVREKGKSVLQVKFEEGKNIIGTTSKESISNMINKVIIVNDDGSKKSEVKNDDLIKVHGLFQDVYEVEEGKDSTSEAKAMLKDIERTMSLSGYGDNTCITGFGVKVLDKITGMAGLFYIDADTHTWEGGNYTIDLELNLQNIMTEVEAGEDEEEKKESTSKTSTSTSSSSSSSSGDTKGDKIASYAKSKIGCKYVWGATGSNTFDCSGLTQWCHKQAGITIPRTSGEQRKAGTNISKDNAKAGDIVCFSGHVGIYVGNGQMIHAPNPKKTVKYDNCFTGYYGNKLLSIRRYW